MKALIWNVWLYGLWWIDILANGFFLYQLCRPFIEFRKGRFWWILLFLTFAGTSGMVIWIGDPNMLYTMPVYFLLFLLCTRGGCDRTIGGWNYLFLPGNVRLCLAGYLCTNDRYLPNL